MTDMLPSDTWDGVPFKPRPHHLPINAMEKLHERF
jgi:hypothetical protein